MGEAKVTLSEIDQSNYVSDTGEVYAAIVVRSPRGDATKPTLVTSIKQLYSRYIGTRIPQGADMGLYSAREYLKLGSNLWVRRYCTNNDSMGAVSFPNNASDISKFAEYPATLAEYIHNKEDVATRVPDDFNGLTLYTKDPGGWGSDLRVDIVPNIAPLKEQAFSATGEITVNYGTGYTGPKWCVSTYDGISAGAPKESTLAPVTVTVFKTVGGVVSPALCRVQDTAGGYTTGVADAFLSKTGDVHTLYIGVDSNGVGVGKIVPEAATGATFTMNIAPRSGEQTNLDQAFIITVKDSTGNILDRKVVSNNKNARDGYGNSIYVVGAFENSAYIGAIHDEDGTGTAAGVPVTTFRNIPFSKARGGVEVGADDLSFKMQALGNFADKEAYPVKVFLDGGEENVAYKLRVAELARSRGDCVAALSTLTSDEFSSDPAGAIVDFRKNRLNLNSSFSALFAGHLYIYDEDTASYKYISPDGYYAGLLSRTQKNAEIWFPVAGLTRGVIDSVLDVSVRFTDGERDYLVDNQINPLRFYSGSGVTIWGNETLRAIESKTQKLHIRQLLNTIEPAMVKTLNGLLFELNDPVTRDTAKVALDVYLDDIVSRRGIDAKRVEIDVDSIPPVELDQDRIDIRVFVTPTGYVHEISLLVTIESNSAISITEG